MNTTYVRRPLSVEALAWTTDNLEDFKVFVGEDYELREKKGDRLEITGKRNNIRVVLFPDDVAVNYNEGFIVKMKPDEFEDEFMPKHGKDTIKVNLFTEDGEVLESRSFAVDGENDSELTKYLCSFAEADPRVARFEIEEQRVVRKGTVDDLRSEFRYLRLPSGEIVQRSEEGVYYHAPGPDRLPILISKEDGEALVRGLKDTL